MTCEQPAHEAAGRTHSLPERAHGGDGVEKGCEGASLPAVDHFVSDESLPGCPAGPQPLRYSTGKQAFEAGSLQCDTRFQVSRGLTIRLELPAGLLHEPVSQIERARPPHPSGGSTDEFGIDGNEQFAKAGLRFEPG